MKRFASSWCLFLAILLLPEVVSPAPDVGSLRKVRNNLGMEFVLIPAGSFMMGSPPDEPYRDPGEIQHRVVISKPFFIQTTEVTLGQWRKLMGRGMMMRWRGPANLPVTRVCCYDIQRFINKLNTRGPWRYRLPTEAEWEYAARAGSTTAYSWGNRIDCSKAMYANSAKVSDCQKYIKSRGLPLEGPAPVKSYPPNKWGLYDMHGNVWEWVQDWFGKYSGIAQVDPQGPPSGNHRVKRGGSWFKFGYNCRSANRAYGHPSSRLRTTGFRLVMEMDLSGRLQPWEEGR